MEKALEIIDDWSNNRGHMREKTSKERILVAAEEIMLEKSFHSVGLKQILDAVKVPKGSFYHYFKSKEDFGVEMMKHYMEESVISKRQLLLQESEVSDPLKRLFTYLESGIAVIHENPGKFPCLALKLASELTNFSEAMRTEFARGFEEWIDIYQQNLNAAVEQKMLPEFIDTRFEAQIIQDLFSGAVQRAVINRDAEPVRCAVQLIKNRISNMQ